MRRSWFFIAALMAVVAPAALAAPRYIFTVAGGGPAEPRSGMLATDTAMGGDLLARTRDGGFIAYGYDLEHQWIWKVEPTGRIRLVARSGPKGVGDLLESVGSLAMGRDGSIYLDAYPGLVRLTPTGAVQVLIGSDEYDVEASDGQPATATNLGPALSVLETGTGRLLVGFDEEGVVELRNGRIWFVAPDVRYVNEMAPDGRGGAWMINLEGRLWHLRRDGEISELPRPCAVLSCLNYFESLDAITGPFAGRYVIAVDHDLLAATTRGYRRLTSYYDNRDVGDGGPARRAGLSLFSDLETIRGNIVISGYPVRLITGRRPPLLVASRPAVQVGQPCGRVAIRYRLTRSAMVKATVYHARGSVSTSARGRPGLNLIRLPYVVPRGLLTFRLLAANGRRAISDYGKLACRTR